jgi:glyceraldehyde 3-phosphate dehydrogenase
MTNQNTSTQMHNHTNTIIGINGLGRIGRNVFRQYISNLNTWGFTIGAVNTMDTPESFVHALQYDSVHKHTWQDIQIVYAEHPNNPAEKNIYLHITTAVGVLRIAYLRHPDPKKIPWGTFGVTMVLECTGRFNDTKTALHAVPTILFSAPANGTEHTVVYGVNHTVLHPDVKYISNGSCTTNALAPIAHVLEKHIGIESGFISTIHAYTSDQNLLDNTHKDLRRSRSAAINIIPTSTGAAKAIHEVIPSLKGKLDGLAFRVPVPNVSLLDCTFILKSQVTIEHIHTLLANYVAEFPEVMALESKPLVSQDYNGNTHSVCIDTEYTKCLGTTLRIIGWYDNETGFSRRMLDMVGCIVRRTVGR